MTTTDYLYVRVQFGELSLFIPQPDVQAVEIIADVHITPTDVGAIGWFGLEHGHGQNSPIFCLSENLLLLPELPKKREFFVLIKAPEVPVGITGDEVENINIKKEHLYFQELPRIMKAPLSPISHLLIFRGKVCCACPGLSLIQYLAYLSSLSQSS